MVVSILYCTPQLNRNLEFHSLCMLVANKMYSYGYNVPMSDVTCLDAWHFSSFRNQIEVVCSVVLFFLYLEVSVIYETLFSYNFWG